VTPVKGLTRLALLPLLALLAACAEPVPEAYADYVGHWRGDGVRLVIRADGHADYDRVQDRTHVAIEGNAHSFSERGFRIGVGPLSADFKVQQAPEVEDGRWRMTVDGVELTRIDILPVESGQQSLRL
jgi:hypothetical protein